MKPAYFDLDSRAIVDISPNALGDGMVVARVNTPPAHRGCGLARQLMAEALADADREGVRLWLDINAYGDMSYEQLAAWYERLGFVLDTSGRYRRDPSGS